MRKFLIIMLLILTLVCGGSPASAASGTHLIPCQDSEAFQERMKSAPSNYYFEDPYQSYASNLLCGDEGLPHLQLRLDRAIDVAIPFVIFFYFTGFIGWSGRAYLIASKNKSNPEELEIFIDIALAIRSLSQGLLWPILVFKELTTKELTIKENELSVSPR